MSDPAAPALDAKTIVEALHRHQVRYVTVGGMAARARGAKRLTNDLDICPAWDKDNLERLAAALRDLDAHVSISGEAAGVEVPGLDGRLLSRMQISNWRTRAGDVDVLFGIPHTSREDEAHYEELHQSAHTIEIDGTQVEVASLEDLIRSKEIADRPSDRQALPELRALQLARALAPARPGR